ncbi:LOW QUALITY PROTEIN: putative dethiobiotin synthetase [Nocardia asteroides NBRC 15531]|uniref:ATP-dependent dethiobiotin synthetase BioD n=1 Tax=Nocardia asteroides NBRC 15531 TaxID=1110697 RepID=U5EDA3_NOCAS|nr:LOW QUALITY PROTEIN: putative dethiobiotin synthetase [Nocardia asteroides NBRC 15531]
MSVLLISGTSTDVGKTVVTAALAAAATAAGRSVAVCKPAQTGIAPGEPGDLAEVARLSGVTRTVELARYPEPLAPDTAARRAGMPLLSLTDTVAAVDAQRDADLVLVEGAGGLLVRMGGVHAPRPRAETRRPGARRRRGRPRHPQPQRTHHPHPGRRRRALRGPGHRFLARRPRPRRAVQSRRSPARHVLVVAAAGLGTLNHSELTTRTLAAAGVPCAGLVIGSWPADPDLAARCNHDDLPRVTETRLVGTIPEGAGRWDRTRFTAAAPSWFAPDWRP